MFCTRLNIEKLIELEKVTEVIVDFLIFWTMKSRLFENERREGRMSGKKMTQISL